MNQWVVWFNVLAFTLMFAAFAFSFMGFLSDRKPWLRSYLLYFSAYALWLLLATYSYFRANFIPGDHTSLDIGIGWTRAGISLLMGYAAPLLVVQLKHGRASRRHLLLCAVAPLVTLAGVVLYSLTASVPLSVYLNMAFNGFQLTVAAWGIIVLRRAVPDPRAGSLRAFFRLSVVLYGLAIGYVVVGQFVRSAIVPASNTVVSGGFGFAWSILVIIDQVRRTHKQGREAGALPPYFLDEYHITDRESSTILHLSEGLTTKEIGAKLFVSHRTVETHCQNIYRKCGVSNRVELLRLTESCRKL